MVQAVGSLPLTWETYIELLAPNFDPVEPTQKSPIGQSASQKKSPEIYILSWN